MVASGGVVNPNAVINAYSNSQNIAGGAGQVTTNIDAGKSTNAPSFSDFMEQTIEQVVDTIKTGETMSAKAVTGEANITDIVQAVTSAEIELQTLVSVRDKMISAYQDIMRMPI